MGLLRGKTWVNIAATVMVALVFFVVSYGLAQAQGAPTPDANAGAATVAENLGITGYRSVVFEALMSIGTMIAWLGGSLFDISIAVFTAGMAQTATYLGLDVAISELWALVRDLFNLFFIFGLIYAGFKIILDANDSASKRTIGTIILAALLINFSLYVAQVVVDFTNVAAYQIHQLIAANDNSGMTIFGIRVPDTTDQFVLFSGINETANEDQTAILRDEVAQQNNESSVNNIGSAIVLGIMFCVFYTILGFVFAACAVILFTRFFALLFLMIFSPLMFLGWVLPSMKSQSTKWWKYFSNQALVGPALLFMIYLSLRALQGIGTTGREGGIIATAIYLLIVTAFLIASLKVAKSFGAYGTDMAMNVGNSARGYVGRAAGGATFGLAARVGRSQIGSRMQRYAESDAAKDAAVNSWVGKRKLNLARKLSDSSFDARNVGDAGRKLGLGSGAKGGYVTRTEQIAKRDKEYAESLGQVSNDDPRVSAAQLEVDATERAIELAREKISANQREITRKQEEKNAATTDTEKARIQGEIDLLRAQATAARGEIDNNKEKLDKQKENVQKEKFRRQIGDSGQVGVFTSQLIDTTRGSIKRKLEAYAEERAKPTPDQNELARLRSEIAVAKKTLAEAEKKANQQAGGYATVVENFGSIKNFFTGRNSEQNQNSGEEIRKEYKKKAKVKE